MWFLWNVSVYVGASVIVDFILRIVCDFDCDLSVYECVYILCIISVCVQCMCLYNMCMCLPVCILYVMHAYVCALGHAVHTYRSTLHVL